MPCLTVAYTRKPFSSGFMIRVASSLSLTPLPLGDWRLPSRCRAAATTWCRRQCRCPTCRFSEPRQKPARRQRAPIPFPRLLSVCLCFAAAFSFFLLSFASGSRFDQKIAQYMPENPAKTSKKKKEKKKRKLHKLLFILLYSAK
jgi:hypothetical protein